MGGIRTGTVGFSYRDWAGIFYPQGVTARRQLGLYAQNFGVCELTQFTHQMPDRDRMAHFAAQLKGDLKFFVRIHNTFTHCADVGLALTIARHFRKAIEPLADSLRLAGLVAPFPYAFKESPETRDYVEQLADALRLGDLPLQVDFRHGSWATEETFSWMRACGLAFVCVDEPPLPGLVPPHAVATTRHLLVRLHGRNAESWWSGNPTTRHDYSYSIAELRELQARYAPLAGWTDEVSFVFQNHWQAQSVKNALQWKALILNDAGVAKGPSESPSEAASNDGYVDEDSLRPPTSLSLSEVKSRVSQAFASPQGALVLPLRK
jgi:uncharacterized protein YecE (DUF72 family)